VNSLKRKNKVNEEITSQRTKVNAEERASEELRKRKGEDTDNEGCSQQQSYRNCPADYIRDIL